MSEPGIQCPLCKRVVKIVLSVTALSPTPKIEEHDWQGEQGDLIDRLSCVQYSVQCPMSGQRARRL